MKRTVLIIIAALAISSVTYCIEKENPTMDKRKTTSVVGNVVDKESGESLAGVAIKFSGISQVLYTDLEGQFEIKDVMPGTYEIEADFISYKQTTSKVKVDLKPENNIKVELENL